VGNDSSEIFAVNEAAIQGSFLRMSRPNMLSDEEFVNYLNATKEANGEEGRFMTFENAIKHFQAQVDEIQLIIDRLNESAARNPTTEEFRKQIEAINAGTWEAEYGDELAADIAKRGGGIMTLEAGIIVFQEKLANAIGDLENIIEAWERSNANVAYLNMQSMAYRDIIPFWGCNPCRPFFQYHTFLRATPQCRLTCLWEEVTLRQERCAWCNRGISQTLVSVVWLGVTFHNFAPNGTGPWCVNCGAPNLGW